MEDKKTLKNKAIMKVIACIASSKTSEHLAGSKRMLNLLYNYKVRNTTLTYLHWMYRAKHKELNHD